MKLIFSSFFFFFCSLVLSAQQNHTRGLTIGEINLPSGTASLIETYANDELRFYRLTFHNQMERSSVDIKTIEFSLSGSAFNAFFDAVKATFKSDIENSVTLGNGIQIHFKMITSTDIEFLIVKDEIPMGSFSTSATGIHLLFGKHWNKSLWKTFLIE